MPVTECDALDDDASVETLKWDGKLFHCSTSPWVLGSEDAFCICDHLLANHRCVIHGTTVVCFTEWLYRCKHAGAQCFRNYVTL